MLGGLDSALVSVVSHLVILEGLEHVVGTGLDLANVGFNLVGVLDLNVGQRGLDQVAVDIGTGAGAIIHDLKLHHLFRECGHVVGQAEFVLTGDADRKAKLTLFLLGPPCIRQSRLGPLMETLMSNEPPDCTAK